MSRRNNVQWLEIAELLYVALIALVWFFWPSNIFFLGGFLFAPWGFRLLNKQFPFKRTAFDGFLLLFMLTALLGVLLAYNSTLALNKFGNLLSACFLFYVIAAQPRENRWLVAGFGACLGAGISFYFLLAHDWRAAPAEFGIINQLGLAIMAVRPQLPVLPLHPNVAASVTAMMLPIEVALMYRLWFKQQKRELAFVAGLSFVTLLGLLLTTSRGAWIAFAGGTGLAILWGLSGRVAKRIQRRPMTVFMGAILVAVLVGSAAVLLFALRWGGLAAFVNVIPSPGGAGNRWSLVADTIRLMGDYRFLGSGLATFPGLYSQYVLVIPFSFLQHSHNMFLDIALEQGVLGLVAMLGMIVINVVVLMQGLARKGVYAERKRPFLLALAVSLVTMLLHGLIDDTLYGFAGTPLLFAVMGYTAMITRRDQATFWQADWISRRKKWVWVIPAVGMLVLFLSIMQPLSASWLATRGALQMARVELQGWPTNQWDTGENVAALLPAKALLHQAAELQPTNRTAHHRLGMIAMLERDYETAVMHLEAAYALDADHQGIVKSLGFSYVWAGNDEAATKILVQIPDAVYELGNYVDWWERNGRLDLSDRASSMLELIDHETITNE